MRNIAEMIKRQTDSILRQTKQGPTGGGGVIVETSDGEESIYNPGMGGRDLAAHKISDDHDARYPQIIHQLFSNTDTIVITHNFGHRPIVQVTGGAGSLLYGSGVYGSGVYGGSLIRRIIEPDNIVHNSVNQVTVTLAGNDSGEVILIG